VRFGAQDNWLTRRGGPQRATETSVRLAADVTDACQ